MKESQKPAFFFAGFFLGRYPFNRTLCLSVRDSHFYRKRLRHERE